LQNQIPGAGDHFFSPWRNKIERSILLRDRHKAHLHTARPVRRPSVCVGGADRAFIPLQEGRSGNKNLFVSGFRTAISDHHVAGLCRSTLRLLAFALDHRDDDFVRLGGPHIDWLRLARQSGSSRVLCSGKVFTDIHGLLRVRGVLAKDNNAQNERFGELAQGQARTARRGPFEHGVPFRL